MSDKTETTGPRAFDKIKEGLEEALEVVRQMPVKDENTEDSPLALCSVEIDALRHALDALAALQNAQLATRDGFASDYLQNAADEVRKAMKGMGA